MNQVEQVPARGWRSWVDANRGQVVDVREPDEWANGTLPEAQRISLSTLPHQLHALDRDKPVLLVCRSGARSNQAAQALAMAGFRRVANMSGGMLALGMA
ncbi:MAG: rhodanese-like domain-containing protein [Acidimicrobiia bacterium]|jgi:rhodanese-related sulfurtransferase